MHKSFSCMDLRLRSVHMLYLIQPYQTGQSPLKLPSQFSRGQLFPSMPLTAPAPFLHRIVTKHNVTRPADTPVYALSPLRRRAHVTVRPRYWPLTAIALFRTAKRWRLYCGSVRLTSLGPSLCPDTFAVGGPNEPLIFPLSHTLLLYS